MRSRTISMLFITLSFAAGCAKQDSTAVESNLRANAERMSAGDTSLHLCGGVLFHYLKPFTGVVVSADRDTRARMAYSEGRLEGWGTIWYANGQAAEQRHYHRGVRNGVQHGWWENGMPRFSYQYQNGEMQGEAVDYFRNGQPFRMLHYTAGHEDGVQQLYREDGSLYANYIVRDGRKYGLTGEKECANVLRQDTSYASAR